MSVFCAAESPNRFPWVINTTFGEKIYIRWCCIDRLSSHELSESDPHRALGWFDSSSRVVGRQRWTPQTYRRRLVKAKQRIAHPLSRTIVHDATDAHKTKSQRVGRPEPSLPYKDALRAGQADCVFVWDVIN